MVDLIATAFGWIAAKKKRFVLCCWAFAVKGGWDDLVLYWSDLFLLLKVYQCESPYQMPSLVSESRWEAAAHAFL